MLKDKSRILPATFYPNTVSHSQIKRQCLVNIYQVIGLSSEGLDCELLVLFNF